MNTWRAVLRTGLPCSPKVHVISHPSITDYLPSGMVRGYLKNRLGNLHILDLHKFRMRDLCRNESERCPEQWRSQPWWTTSAHVALGMGKCRKHTRFSTSHRQNLTPNSVTELQVHS